MAILTTDELARVRNTCERAAVGGVYTKGQINAVLQAIEDAMTTRPIAAGDVAKTLPQIISGIIDAASPVAFTATQKRRLFALWAELKFDRDK